MTRRTRHRVRHADHVVWTTSRATRLSCWIVVGVAGVVLVVGVVVLVSALLGAGGDLDAGSLSMGLAALPLPMLLAAWRLGLHPRVVVGDAGVLVVNPLRSRHVPWVDIERVSAERNGIALQLRSGRIVYAWAVQTSSFSSRRHRADTDGKLALLRRHLR